MPNISNKILTWLTGVLHIQQVSSTSNPCPHMSSKCTVCPQKSAPTYRCSLVINRCPTFTTHVPHVHCLSHRWVTGVFVNQLPKWTRTMKNSWSICLAVSTGVLEHRYLMPGVQLNISANMQTKQVFGQRCYYTRVIFPPLTGVAREVCWLSYNL